MRKVPAVGWCGVRRPPLTCPAPLNVRKLTLMKIVNLTGHPLVLGSEERHIVIPSAGRVRLDARYDVQEHVSVTRDGVTVSVPLLVTKNGSVVSLPEPAEDTLIVVSGLVAGRVRRRDVVSPARLHKVNNRVQYARALMRYVK